MKRIKEEVPIKFMCDGPYCFGPEIARVCCHGWNSGHFLTEREVDNTQQLINCGVITHPTEQYIQQVVEVKEQ